MPASVSFGKALSQWENEFDEDEWIVELVIGGAKSYSYKTNKGKVVIKQKGITVDVATTDVIDFLNNERYGFEPGDLEIRKNIYIRNRL